jgi:uncharacterized protein (TIGR00730 family)
LGTRLAAEGIGLVYGGGSVGLMGVVADAVLAGGGEAVGVIPEALAGKEVAHPGLTRLHVVRSMHERKALMAEIADAFVALPGGYGTLDEVFEAITWGQLASITSRSACWTSKATSVPCSPSWTAPWSRASSARSIGRSSSSARPWTGCSPRLLTTRRRLR